MPYIRVRPEGLQRMSEMLDRVEKDIDFLLYLRKKIVYIELEDM